ncbi:MAG: Crp/Fnr family transcriptional regulator [Hydrogenophaga sp.]|uniref:Crp/Fnr family transcriptional regulator n=1 Tax=Hydrogenophaga sp. TaxID=1904254 RepID=UPI002ABB2C3F|nr:Crp/Fnr family transcriptional regulator [Hydrogenophaga sp.]MDZ4282982.1 Crp/Fnr family transcriptional regulator [Hydrogenophaga sp.]
MDPFTTVLTEVSELIEPDKPRQNQLLASLPHADWQRWQPLLEWVDLPLKKTLHEVGAPLQFVYFPTNAIISLLNVNADGSPAQTAVVGREGVVGISILMGHSNSPSRTVVQSAGMGYRIPAVVIKAELERSVPVMHLMLRYTQALITQMSQTAACNRHHSLDQQLCRWLLLILDRLPGDEVTITHELIAHMLCSSREDVIEAALDLQICGLIQYARGRISVLDRPGLQRRSCECYQVVKSEYDRLLPNPEDVSRRNR